MIETLLARTIDATQKRTARKKETDEFAAALETIVAETVQHVAELKKVKK